MAEIHLSASKRSRSADSRVSMGKQSEQSDAEDIFSQTKGHARVSEFLVQTDAGELILGVEPYAMACLECLELQELQERIQREYVLTNLCFWPREIDIQRKFSDIEGLQRGRMQAAKLNRDPSHAWALEGGEEINIRTRYAGIQAWANSRLHLRVPEGECDFINASPIVLRASGNGEEFKYIASQGPQEHDIADFWNMIYHDTGEVAVIIMLTKTIEDDREKCAQYFPPDLLNPTLNFPSENPDPFNENHFSGSVTLLESSYNEKLRSNIRKLELRVGSKTKIVWHFLFAGWSDFARPEGPNRDALLELTAYTAEIAQSPSNPRVVHCSAGVGRTGTFIAVDHLLRELRSGKLFDAMNSPLDPVFHTVNRLREQRMWMVYNVTQYQFIHDILGEQAIVLGLVKPLIDLRPKKMIKSTDGPLESELMVRTLEDIPTPTEEWSDESPNLLGE